MSGGEHRHNRVFQSPALGGLDSIVFESHRDLEAIRPYFRRGERDEDTLTVKEIGDRLLVSWERNDEGGWGWTEGEGIFDQLVGAREELMRGDSLLWNGWTGVNLWM